MLEKGTHAAPRRCTLTLNETNRTKLGAVLKQGTMLGPQALARRPVKAENYPVTVSLFRAPREAYHLRFSTANASLDSLGSIMELKISILPEDQLFTEIKDVETDKSCNPS